MSQLSERKCAGGRARDLRCGRRGRGFPASKRPRVLQACSNHDTFQSTSLFQGMCRHFENSQSACRCVTQQLHFALQTKLRILFAHPQLTEVPEEAGPMRRGARLGPKRLACVEPKYSAERPQRTYTMPALIMSRLEERSQELSGEPFRGGRKCIRLDLTVSDPGPDRSGRYLLLREACSLCRLFPRGSRLYFLQPAQDTLALAHPFKPRSAVALAFPAFKKQLSPTIFNQ